MWGYLVSQIRNQSRRTLCLALLFAVFAMLLLAGCAQSPALSPLPEEPIQATAEQVQSLEKSVPRGEIYDGYEAASVEEAVSRLHFPVVVPKVLPAGYRLDAIYTTYPEDTLEALKLIYTDGKYHLVVGQQPRNEPAPNLSDAYVAELRQEKVTVGTHVGLGHGPGISQTRDARPEYASVTWTPPGLMRLVGSVDDPTLTLEDILAVAESMESAP